MEGLMCEHPDMQREPLLAMSAWAEFQLVVLCRNALCTLARQSTHGFLPQNLASFWGSGMADNPVHMMGQQACIG